ncbi:O-antigen ligase family protein [Aquamicrobium sp. LC103]|uniref:O-antigen ligase family protein n=1 Tax=Aquamicrobium sp. LC103 TaxID=1120658 RepID=UPI000A4EB62F|nr:O-antigen ligase family protein [Aquamicrobium sp. LC103]
MSLLNSTTEPPFIRRSWLDTPIEPALAVVAGVIVFFLTTHSFQFLFADTVVGGMAERASGRGNLAYLALYGAQGGIFALLMVMRVVSGAVTVRLGLAITFCLFVVGSAFWSIGSSSTLFYATVLSNQVIAAYLLAQYLTPKQFLRLFFFVAAIITVSSFVLLFIAPELVAQERYGGGWLGDYEYTGVMSSKNLGSYVFVAALLLAWHGRLIDVGWSWRLIVGVLALCSIALSSSATALLAAVFLIGLSTFIRLIRPQPFGLFFAVYLALLTIVVTVPFIDIGNLLGVIGRDATFTGRTELWALAFEAIADRPVLGHGYYGFFDTNPFSPVWNFWEHFLYFLTDTFHNSAIDTTVSLGFVGLAIMCAVCVFAGLIAFDKAVEAGVRILSLTILSVFVIGSSMELAIFHHNYIATIIVFYFAFVANKPREPGSRGLQGIGDDGDQAARKAG